MQRQAKGRLSEMSVKAVVTRADGRVEDLGEVSYWHRNPLKRWSRAVRRWFKERLKNG